MRASTQVEKISNRYSAWRALLGHLYPGTPMLCLVLGAITGLGAPTCGACAGVNVPGRFFREGVQSGGLAWLPSSATAVAVLAALAVALGGPAGHARKPPEIQANEGASPGTESV